MIGAIQRVIAEERVFVGIVLIASVLSVAALAFDEVWLSLVPLAAITLISTIGITEHYLSDDRAAYPI